MNIPVINTPEYSKLIAFFNKCVGITERAVSSKDFCELLLTSLYEIFNLKNSAFWLLDTRESNYFLACQRIKNLVSLDFCTKSPLFADNLKDKYPLIGNKNVITIQDIMSTQEYEESQYYKEYLQGTDPFYYAALMLLRSSNGIIGAVGFLKSKTEGDFTSAELSNMNVISGFISNLAVNHLMVRNIITQKCLLESLSNQSPTGLIIFNPNSPYKIIYINSAALRYTKEFCPNVPEGSLGNEFLLNYILEDFRFPEYASSKTIKSPFEKTYIVHTAPSQSMDKYASTVYVYIIPQVAMVEKKEPAFLKDNNLTQRQLEIVKLVMEGKTNEEIALRLFISMNTVKTHLNNIYRELNVNSRFALYTKLVEN